MKSFFLIFLCAISCLFSEEGMWPFDQIPKEKIQKNYGVVLDDQWIQNVQLSCLRVATGGSGSFISSKGLVMTNHHVGASIIHHLSSAEKNYLKDGFYAKNYDLELPCPNLYFDQLIAISDVTEEVFQNVREEMSFAEKEKAKQASIAVIQKKAQEKTGLQPEVVMLYHGAKYHLYLYERYTDIRLVMAPEKTAAFLGGDIDNFEYPRYNLDVCFFRVYKDGKPLETTHYLKWGSGPKDGELLFVAGHPGKTKRMITAEHLAFLKEVEIPLFLQFLEEKLRFIDEFSSQSEESKRIALQARSSIANAYKVYKGMETDLLNPSLLEDKRNEDAFFEKNLSEEEYAPWQDLSKALKGSEYITKVHFILEGVGSGYCKLYDIAKTLVRLSKEVKKPDEERLPEYVETERKRLSLKIESLEPFYLEYEEASLADALQRLETILGKDHPLAKKLFSGKNPKEVAHSIIEGTSLHQIGTRKYLYAHLEEIEENVDPLLVLAETIDPYAREIRRKKEDGLDSIEKECYVQIAKQKLAYSKIFYPDATFTLRLSLGEMKGYEEEGKWIDPVTTIGEGLEHSLLRQSETSCFFSERWHGNQQLDKNALFNFVSTHDIVGGNSGSPMFNLQGEWVGLIFDGNKQSLNSRQTFDEIQGRAISVHSLGIVEALKNVYQAELLVKEIQGF